MLIYWTIVYFSVQSNNRIFVKGYGVLSFAKNMGKHIGRNIGKNLSSEYSQILLDHIEQSATNDFNTVSKRAIPKTAEATVDLIGNKIADQITKLWKTSPENSSETVKNEHDKEITKERYISPEKRQKTIDHLR